MLTKLYDRFAKQPYAESVRFSKNSYFKVRLGRQVYVEVECHTRVMPKDYFYLRCGEQVLCNEHLPMGFVAENIDLIIKRIERLLTLSLAFESDLDTFTRCNNYRLTEAGFVKEQENAD